MARSRKCAPSLLFQAFQRSTKWVKTAGITWTKGPQRPIEPGLIAKKRRNLGCIPSRLDLREDFECLGQSPNVKALSGASQVVGEGFDVGDRIEVLSDEKVEVGDVSPWNINDVIRFDHYVGTQVSHIENSL
jgi:hypothetical protein